MCWRSGIVLEGREGGSQEDEGWGGGIGGCC